MLKLLKKTKRHKNKTYINTPSNDTIHKIAYRRKIRNFFRSFKKWFVVMVIILFLIIILGSILFYIINYIVYLKTGHSLIRIKKTAYKTIQLHNVIGLNEIPAFPQSYFLFNDFISNSKDLNNPKFLTNIPIGYTKDEIRVLYTFLAKHKSIYIIDSKYTFEDVVEFYRKKLPALGWKHLFTISEDNQEKIPGVYFVNLKKHIGLHLYTITGHDVWYEIITEQQAQTALVERKIALKLKNLEIKVQNGKKLPSQSFWKLKYPSDWNLDISISPTLKVPSLFLSNKKQNSHLHIIPIKYTPKPVELLEFKDLLPPTYSFIKEWGNNHGIKISPKKAVRKNLILHDTKALELCFHNSYKNYPNLCFLTFPNSKNTIFYAIIFWGNEIEFYNYVRKNIEPLK